MKKLMVAVATFALAVNALAAVANWKVTGGNIYAGDASTKYAGTAYFFDVAILSQSDLFTAFSSNTSYDFAGNAKGSLTIANGAFQTSANTFSYGDPGSNYGFYFVLLTDDKQSIYFSNLVENRSALNPPSQQSLAFASQNNGTTTFSATAAADGFQGAGKWSSVPEPTSGLLMLLGFAGLALRRKQK